MSLERSHIPSYQDNKNLANKQGLTFQMPMEICLGCFDTHSKKFPSVGEGPISMNIPPRKEEGYYAYSLRVEGVL
jgi:hypothetical protein